MKLKSNSVVAVRGSRYVLWLTAHLVILVSTMNVKAPVWLDCCKDTVVV